MNTVLEVRGLEKNYGPTQSGQRSELHRSRIGDRRASGTERCRQVDELQDDMRHCPTGSRTGVLGRARGDGVAHVSPRERRTHGYLAQESSVFRKLSVEQNILAIFELLGVPYRERRKRTEELLEDFDITHIRRSKAGRLSGGERRRLEIARCLVTDPQIVMLDEPFAGIDPVTVQSIQEIIVKLRDRGIAILITDHAAREILQTVDRCYVISKGSVLCEGDPDQIMQHPDVRKEYLGDISEVFPRQASVPKRSNKVRLSLVAEDQPAETTDVAATATVPAPHGWFRRNKPAAPAASESASQKESPDPNGPQRPVRRRTDV